MRCFRKTIACNINIKGKGATREGAKGAEAPPLAKLKLRNKIKCRIVLNFLCLSDLKLLDLANL